MKSSEGVMLLWGFLMGIGVTYHSPYPWWHFAQIIALMAGTITIMVLWSDER